MLRCCQSFRQSNTSRILQPIILIFFFQVWNHWWIILIRAQSLAQKLADVPRYPSHLLLVSARMCVVLAMVSVPCISVSSVDLDSLRSWVYFCWLLSRDCASNVRQTAP